MDLSFETIDALREVVGKISTDVFAKLPPKRPEKYRHKGKNRIGYHNNDFANDPLNGRMPSYRMVDGGKCLRIFCGSEYAFFDLRNVRLREIQNLEYGDPVIVDKNVNPVTVKSWSNNSDTSEEHKLTTRKSYSRSETKTTATGFSLQITQSLKTKVGGGIEGIAEAEVETGLEIQSNFEQRFEKSQSKQSSTEETEEQTYIVPPRTKTTLLREEGISDYHQTVRMTGILDASMWIGSHNDFWFPIESFVDLQRVIRGGSADGVDWHIANCFRERKFQKYEIDFSPLHMTVEDVLHFRNVQSSEIERTDTPL